MNKREKTIREQLIYATWTEAKSDLTMRTLGNSFSTSTSNVNRCIKKWKDKKVDEFKPELQSLIRKVR